MAMFKCVRLGPNTILKDWLMRGAAGSRSSLPYGYQKRLLHTSGRLQLDEYDLQTIKSEERTLQTSQLFEASEDKSKEQFFGALDIYKSRMGNRPKGNVEFIRAALRNMKLFGVEKDLEAYRSLLDVMPKGKYVATTEFQIAYKHFPKQQDCITELLHQMERNNVMPDEEIGDMLHAIFGEGSHPIRKFYRMVYWMAKLRNISPYPLPLIAPKDPKELAYLAIQQICSVDRYTEIKEFNTEDLEDSLDKTWIISGQSDEQRGMIQMAPKDKALYVEGGFRVWLRDSQVTYFVLRGEGVPPPPVPLGERDDPDPKGFYRWMLGEAGPDPSHWIAAPNVHQQSEGTIYSCCATGSSSRDSLLSWIRFLQQDNPELKDISILFSLSSPLGPVVKFEDSSSLA